MPWETCNLVVTGYMVSVAPDSARSESSFAARQKMSHISARFVGLSKSYAVDRAITTLPQAWLNFFLNSRWFSIPS
jgi:hypothetical protein